MTSEYKKPLIEMQSFNFEEEKSFDDFDNQNNSQQNDIEQFVHNRQQKCFLDDQYTSIIRNMEEDLENFLYFNNCQFKA